MGAQQGKTMTAEPEKELREIRERCDAVEHEGTEEWECRTCKSSAWPGEDTYLRIGEWEQQLLVTEACADLAEPKQRGVESC